MAKPEKEVEEEAEQQLEPKQKEREGEKKENSINDLPQPSSSNRPAVPIPSSSPFSFWFYATLAITLFTVLVSIIHSLYPNNSTTSWFLSLPVHLRDHYSNGTLIKTHLLRNHPPTKIFTIECGPKDAAETIFLVHGLGSSSFSFRHVLQRLGTGGFRAVAVDLPGSGFSDGLVEDEILGGVLGWLSGIWKEVREKGLFWGFDQLIEMGYVEYKQEKPRVRISMETAVVGRIIGQVIDSLGLAPVHLVAHDSAAAVVASWVSVASPESVSSVTFVDSSLVSAAFPSWILGVPVLREVVLGSKWVFAGLLRVCCSREIDDIATEAYRLMLKRKGGRSAVVETGKALNYSFDVGEWAGSEAVRDVPLQVLWSHMMSDLWIEEGRRVAEAVPRARFIPHLGGRWPQEGAAEEISGRIVEFVMSLPKSNRQQVDENRDSGLIKDTIDKVNNGHQHNHLHDHDHAYAAGYMDAYGLGDEFS